MHVSSSLHPPDRNRSSLVRADWLFALSLWTIVALLTAQLWASEEWQPLVAIGWAIAALIYGPLPNWVTARRAKAVLRLRKAVRQVGRKRSSSPPPPETDTPRNEKGRGRILLNAPSRHAPVTPCPYTHMGARLHAVV